MNEINIKNILLEQQYVSDVDMQRAEKESLRQGLSLVPFLIQNNLITKELIGQAIAESLKMPFANLDDFKPSSDLVHMLPEQLARQNRAVVWKATKAGLQIALDHLPTPELDKELKKIVKDKKITYSYTLPEFIDESLREFQPALNTRFSEIIKAGGKIAPEIIDQIIEDAVALKASDIHFEPQEKEVLIRFRIDGVLHESGRLDKQYYDNIVNRIKVQAKLRIDEHQSAQDGAIHYLTEVMAVDLRISILPTMEGEKVVLRLLTAYVREVSFSGLGLSDRASDLFTQTAKKPFGMILVTGPTGSGKTTSLYSLVKYLQKPEVNITTIEDPVEYKIQGINQIQVNQQTNLTFSKGLRSIARQDPDVILVGEIRDLETAEIAVNAALTGHLLLSTFHANDAVSSIPRLLDMGIEPFLLASTLELIVAQRLVRRICESCRFSEQMSLATLKKKHPVIANYFPKGTTLYSGKGCSSCNLTGYKGRVAVFELLHVTSEMQDLIVSNPASNKLFELARAQGLVTMWEDGLDKVRSGTTTITELMRVVQPPKK